MLPKEKAEELILKFMRLQEPNYNWFHSKLAKQCALIAVDEMIIQNGELYLNGLDNIYYRKINNFLFEVKQEIKKL